jgi:hypothetical protein
MSRYRKKPVVIEAIRYTGHVNATEVIDWVLAGDGTARFLDGPLAIDTLEGTMLAQPGDYVIRGVQGEFYPCKPDIFEATYEPVKETA